MKQEGEPSKIQGHPNPHEKQLKKPITIRLGVDVIEYFKELAEESGIPYQNVINMYLRECVESKKRLRMGFE